MITVMIVDDEILVRIGVKSIIPWKQYEFEVVGEAENGERALALARELQPDIMITDIKMPLLNGIELIQAMKAEQLETKFVVLSSYGDFNYVKEAMQLGAEDYILKLNMEPEQLLDILNKIKEKIERERSERAGRQQNLNQYQTYLPSLRESLFNRILFGYFKSNEDIAEQLDLMHVVLPQRNIFCLLTQVDSIEIIRKYTENDLYVISYSISNIMQEIVNEFQWGYVFAVNPLEFAIIYADDTVSGVGTPEEKIRDMAERIHSALKTYLNISIAIGVGGGQKTYADIRIGYRQASTALEHGFALPKGSTIFFSRLPASLPSTGSAFDQEFAALEQAFVFDDLDKIIDLLETMGRSLLRCTQITKMSIQGFCSSIYFMFQALMKRKDVSPKDPDWAVIPPDKFLKLQDYADWILQVKNTAERMRLLDCHTMITKAKQFIHEHFNENISLQTVADHVHLSANYLSHVFKRETDENFIDYLIGIRIRHAKSLIRSTDSLIYEIGESVGYRDLYYFSKLFKKVTGMTPSQYRNAQGKERS
ncbi:response regulator transcription factor [Paenibacillus humicola]|uniref:response regulator transcription factor n=1 Tax=Paenibacillus humicola TaxID=3110540 RepID=UPI00237A5204|nr:response regulator transcription factor [Paenibacillus humicola]